MPDELEISELPEGVKSVNIKEQKVFDGVPFPLILNPTDGFKDMEAQFWNDWVKKNLGTIEDLLLKYGAILFREFPFDNPEDFDEFAKAYGYDPFLNVPGVGVRKNVVGNAYTASEAPPEFKIPFHHEMGHTKEFPLVLFFYCDVPPVEGGNTPLALSNVIYRKMAEREPELVRRLEREGLRYMRIAPDGDNSSVSYGRGWQSTFFTSDKEEAEKNAKAKGYDFEWLEDGSMKTITDVLPAIRVDKRTGKTMWFNSAFTYAMMNRYTGDYTNIAAIFPNFDTVDPEKIDTLKEVMDDVRVSFKWQRKDVVMIDNRSVQHSRDDFSLPPRRILASLYNDHQGTI